MKWINKQYYCCCSYRYRRCYNFFLDETGPKLYNLDLVYFIFNNFKWSMDIAKLKFNDTLLYILPFIRYCFSFFLLFSCLCSYSFSSNCEYHVFCSCLYYLMVVTGLVKWTLGKQEGTCLPLWLNDGVVAWLLYFNLWKTCKFSLFCSFLP